MWPISKIEKANEALNLKNRFNCVTCEGAWPLWPLPKRYYLAKKKKKKKKSLIKL